MIEQFQRARDLREKSRGEKYFFDVRFHRAPDLGPMVCPDRVCDTREMLQRVYRWSYDLIHRPAQVFWICALLACVQVVLDGTAFRLWGLHRDHQIISERISEGRARSRQLDYRIQQAAEPAFIEKAVRDQFDLVKKGDLIFIFSEDPSSGSTGES